MIETGARIKMISISKRSLSWYRFMRMKWEIILSRGIFSTYNHCPVCFFCVKWKDGPSVCLCQQFFASAIWMIEYFSRYETSLKIFQASSDRCMSEYDMLYIKFEPNYKNWTREFTIIHMYTWIQCNSPTLYNLHVHTSTCIKVGLSARLGSY